MCVTISVAVASTMGVAMGSATMTVVATTALIVQTAVAVATVGMGVAQMVDGNIAGGLGMIAGGVGMGVAGLGAAKSVSTAFDGMFGNSADPLAESSGITSAVSKAIPAKPPSSVMPNNPNVTNYVGDVGSTSGANNNFGFTQTPVKTPSVSVDPNVPIGVVNATQNALGGKAMQNTLTSFLPTTVNDLANNAGTTSNALRANAGTNAPTTGGILGALGSQAGTNVLGMVGSGLNQMAQGQQAKDLNQQAIDARAAEMALNRQNSSAAGLVMGNKTWNPLKGQWVPINA